VTLVPGCPAVENLQPNGKFLCLYFAEIPEATKGKSVLEILKRMARPGKFFLAVAIAQILMDTIRSQCDPDRRCLA
jgi:hypothetical protein